jgi:hypothetical protein
VAARTAPTALAPAPFAITLVTPPVPDRPEQAGNDWRRAGLCQGDRTAGQARLGPPRLSHPGIWGPAPPPAQTASPAEQPPGGSRQRDPQRVGHQRHQEPAPAPGTRNAARSAKKAPRHPVPAPLWLPGDRPGKDVAPQPFTRHHNQRRQDHGQQPGSGGPQEVPGDTTVPHDPIVRHHRERARPPGPQRHRVTVSAGPVISAHIPQTRMAADAAAGPAGYALFAAVAYIRAAASRASVPIAEACQGLALPPADPAP